MRTFAGALLTAALCVAAAAQQALNNDAVVKMVKAGLDEGTIVTMIQNAPGHYDMGLDALVALRKDGVTDKEIGAMVAKNNAPAVPAPAAASPYDNLDIGVYQNVKGQWVLIPTEIVNWKTGGVLKSIASDGIVKGDINGHIGGAVSPTKIESPMQFLIKTANGVEAVDYQLVHLHDKRNAREFRTLTGGVFHASGGTSRDAIPFKQNQIAKRTFAITLPPNMPPGEYAFLPPGISGSTAAGSSGWAYTFDFVE